MKPAEATAKLCELFDGHTVHYDGKDGTWTVNFGTWTQFGKDG